MFANTTMSSRGCELVETADDHWRLSRAGGGDKPSRFSGLSGLPPPPSAFLIFEKSPPLLAAPSLPAARRLACAGRTALAADAAAMQRLGVRHVTKPLQTSSALSAACTRTFCALGGGLARARKVRPVTSLQALKVSGTGSEMGDEWRQGARTQKRENVQRPAAETWRALGRREPGAERSSPWLRLNAEGLPISAPLLLSTLRISLRKDKNQSLASLSLSLQPLNALPLHGNHGGHDTREGQVAEEQVRRRCHPR